MKTTAFLFFSGCLLQAISVGGQGTVVYDQQSSIDGIYLEGSIQDVRTISVGQSFTPLLDSVGFVRLALIGATHGDTTNGLFYVTMRSGSISGPILGTSSVVTLDPSFTALTSFDFPNPVAVTPGTTYFFDLTIQSGNRWAILWDRYNYPGGVGYASGVANSLNDLWFREGIIVPEPGVVVLLGLGLLGYVVRRTKQ